MHSAAVNARYKCLYLYNYIPDATPRTPPTASRRKENAEEFVFWSNDQRKNEPFEGMAVIAVEESEEMEDAILMISSEVFEKDKWFSFEMSLDMKENLPKEFWES